MRLTYVSFNIMLVWLENAYSRPFLGCLGHIPPNDVTYRPNRKNDRPWAKPRHLSQKTAKIGCAVRAGRVNEKKRTGQDRQKVTKGLYFTYLFRNPH